jgi:aarF domain-containing kinase
MLTMMITGFVHCDPHEANVLIRRKPNDPHRPQLVLLDHGLYKDLSEDFRRNYCRLWNAIILQDRVEIESECRNLKAGEAYPLLAAILTMKPWNDVISDDVDRLHNKGSKGENEMLKAYAKKYFKEVVVLLGEMPSDMLLMLKTNDCLRHIDRALGVPINSAAVIGATTASVLLRDEMQAALSGLSSSMKPVGVLRALWRYVKVMLRVGGLRILSGFFSWNNTVKKTAISS